VIDMVDMALVIMTVVFGVLLGFTIRYFTSIYEAQFNITDKLIKTVNELKEDIQNVQRDSARNNLGFDVTGNEVMQHIVGEDPHRTHILGGFVHGDAICADDCWCKTEEE